VPALLPIMTLFSRKHSAVPTHPVDSTPYCLKPPGSYKPSYVSFRTLLTLDRFFYAVAFPSSPPLVYLAIHSFRAVIIFLVKLFSSLTRFAEDLFLSVNSPGFQRIGQAFPSLSYDIPIAWKMIEPESAALPMLYVSFHSSTSFELKKCRVRLINGFTPLSVLPSRACLSFPSFESQPLLSNYRSPSPILSPPSAS